MPMVWRDHKEGRGALITDGMLVTVVYSVAAKLSDFTAGRLLDTNLRSEPLRVVFGSGCLIESIEQAIGGIRVGGTRRIKVATAELASDWTRLVPGTQSHVWFEVYLVNAEAAPPPSIQLDVLNTKEDADDSLTVPEHGRRKLDEVRRRLLVDFEFIIGTVELAKAERAERRLSEAHRLWSEVWHEIQDLLKQTRTSKSLRQLDRLRIQYDALRLRVDQLLHG